MAGLPSGSPKLTVPLNVISGLLEEFPLAFERQVATPALGAV